MISLPLLLLCTIFTAALASDFRVTVGISQITGQVGTGFDPNRIVPAAGDTITFSWSIPSYINNPQTGSYSAVQGTANSPCQPMAGGFDSGVHTTAPESSGQGTTMVFQVKDSQPLYFYSSVDGQCKSGMVLGVNTPASGDGSVDSYITAAGGNPNQDTTLGNSTSTTNNATTPTTTASNSSTSTSSSSSAKANVTSPLPTASASANAKKGSATSNGPQSVVALVVCLIALSLVL